MVSSHQNRTYLDRNHVLGEFEVFLGRIGCVNLWHCTIHLQNDGAFRMRGGTVGLGVGLTFSVELYLLKS